MIAIIFIAAWIACGIVSGLAFYCYFQREYPLIAAEDKKMDTVQAVTWGLLLGPCALIATALVGGFKHGINPFRK